MYSREVNMSFPELLSFPFTGVFWILSEIQEIVNRELYDEQTIIRKLLEVQQAYELGEVDEATYSAAWAEYRQRLELLSQEKASDLFADSSDVQTKE